MTFEQPSPVDPQDAVPARERVVVHRAPKIWGFLGLGAILGVVATLVLTLLFRPTDGSPTVTEDGTEFGLTQVFGFLLVCLIPLGAALGALVAIVLDRVLSRRAVEVDVERIDVLPPATANDDLTGDGLEVERAERTESTERTERTEPAVPIETASPSTPPTIPPTIPNEDSSRS